MLIHGARVTSATLQPQGQAENTRRPVSAVLHQTTVSGPWTVVADLAQENGCGQEAAQPLS